MKTFFTCRNCGNEEQGTRLYLCSNEHRYCHACATVIIYDMQRILCPVCKQDHKEAYGIIWSRKEDPDDDNIDDFIDDDINDHDVNDY